MITDDPESPHFPMKHPAYRSSRIIPFSAPRLARNYSLTGVSLRRSNDETTYRLIGKSPGCPSLKLSMRKSWVKRTSLRHPDER